MSNNIPERNAEQAAEIMSRYRPIVPRPGNPETSFSERPPTPERFSDDRDLKNLWYTIVKGPIRTRKRSIYPFPEPSVKRQAMGICTSHVISALPLRSVPPLGFAVLPSTELSLATASSARSVAKAGAIPSAACGVPIMKTSSGSGTRPASLGTLPATPEISSRGVLKNLETRPIAAPSSAAALTSTKLALATSKSAGSVTRLGATPRAACGVPINTRSSSFVTKPAPTSSSACHVTSKTTLKSPSLATRTAAKERSACGSTSRIPGRSARLGTRPAATAFFASNATSTITAKSRLAARQAASLGHARGASPVLRNLPRLRTRPAATTSLACNITSPITTRSAGLMIRPAPTSGVARGFTTPIISNSTSRVTFHASQTYACSVTASRVTSRGGVTLPGTTVAQREVKVTPGTTVAQREVKSSAIEASACIEKPLYGTPVSTLSSLKIFPASAAYACSVMTSRALCSSSGPVHFPVLSRPASAFTQGRAALPESRPEGRRAINIDLNTAVEGQEWRDSWEYMKEPILNTVIKPKPLNLIASKITITRIAEGLFFHRSIVKIPCQAQSLEEKVESDVLASIVTDSENKVRIANTAYKEMVGQPDCKWLDWLISKQKRQVRTRKCTRICGQVDLQFSNTMISALSKGFSCCGTIEWESQGQKRLLNISADAVRVICTKKDYQFIWRFFTNSNELLESSSRVYK